MEEVVVTPKQVRFVFGFVLNLGFFSKGLILVWVSENKKYFG